LFEPGDGCTRDDHIFGHASAAGADGANHDSIDFDGNAAAENNDTTGIGGMNAEGRLAALRELRELIGRAIECSRRPGFVDRDVYAAQPRAIHACVRYQRTARIDDGDVVRNPEFCGLALARCNYSSGVSETEGLNGLRHLKLSRSWLQ
jgi:hypothetical protein